MSYNCRVIKDSLSPAKVRLTTLEITFPRFVLAEFNTHRVFSRNSASSRAIPVEKTYQRVSENPVLPLEWGKNQRGMQADEEVDAVTAMKASKIWNEARGAALFAAKALADLGVHKQIANRILEPFMWHTVLVTSTEWRNFFALRMSKDAQPEIRAAANLMWEAMMGSEPLPVEYGQWHLPLVSDEEVNVASWNDPDLDVDYWKKVSVGRCARVSYLTHDGRRDPEADVQLHDRLLEGGHMSPFEHVATPGDLEPQFSNFWGWHQYRKDISNEDAILHTLDTVTMEYL